MLILFIVTSVIVHKSLPHRMSTMETKTLSLPISDTYRTLVLRLKGTRDGGMSHVEEMKLTLIPTTGSVFEMKVDPDQLSYEYVDSKGKVHSSANALDVQAMLAWMAQANIDTEEPRVGQEADEVVQCLQLIADGLGIDSYQFTCFRSLSGTGHARPTGVQLWFGWISLGFWPIVWLLGIWRIVRRRPSTQVVAA